MSFERWTCPVDCNNQKQQTWFFDGLYIRSGIDDKKCIDVPGGDFTNGRKLQLWFVEKAQHSFLLTVFFLAMQGLQRVQKSTMEGCGELSMEVSHEQEQVH